MNSLKYLSVVSLPLLAFFAFQETGIYTILPLIFAFIVLPVLELFIKPDSRNFTEMEEQRFAKSVVFDVVIYMMVPIHFALYFIFISTIGDLEISLTDKIGRTFSMGLLCGVLGINVAHELGHRVKNHEKFMAISLLITSLYSHFFIEHNRGHHKSVATPEDPSTARKNEMLFVFWFRSVFQTYVSAWHIVLTELKRKKIPFLSFKNTMLYLQIIQILWLFIVFYFFGLQTLAFTIAAGIIGFLLLETVNYIEHYGLLRKKVSQFRYEDPAPEHSWNSNHLIGRLMLFELSRHSDHHFQPHRKYQILRHHQNSPQMPTGYPGMMLLSLFPPLWFKIMNKKLDQLNT